MRNFTGKGNAVACIFASVLALGIFGATAGHADTKRREADRPANYPRQAYKQGIEGEATVECTIKPNFRPGDCVILVETPPGMGFGEAALRTVKAGRFDPGKPETVGTRYKATFQ